MIFEELKMSLKYLDRIIKYTESKVRELSSVQ